MFNFFSKIATAFKVWSQNLKSFLFMPKKIFFSFLKNLILKLYAHLSNFVYMKSGGIELLLMKF